MSEVKQKVQGLLGNLLQLQADDLDKKQLRKEVKGTSNRNITKINLEPFLPVRTCIIVHSDWKYKCID